MGTNDDLRWLYLIYNKRYFGNRLPKDMPVKFCKLRKHTYGRTAVAIQTHRPQFIEINNDLRTALLTAQFTLLHEMVHVENPKPTGHGKWFNKRMLRLARAGAFNGKW